MLERLNELGDSKQTMMLGEVESFLRKHYPTANTLKKIQMKCWYYYAQGRNKGGKGSISFSQFCNKVSIVDLITLVKGCSIDCHDIGGKDIVLKYLMEWSNSSEKEELKIVMTTL